jgi:hypothetical protein
MHESEWLPKVLQKTDLVHICTVLNLSVDGFRISSLATRPVEQLRGLVGSSLRSGIGKKKRFKTSPNAIPLDIFYDELATDARKDRIPLQTDDYDAFMLALISDGNWRPYQKLALLYDQNREIYNTHYEKIVQNAQNKTDLFAGIYAVNESQIIEQLQHQTQIPSMEDYMDYVMKAGWTDRYASIKEMLRDKPDGVSKLLVVNALKEGDDRFLGQLALLPEYPQLEPGVYAYYMQMKLFALQETAAAAAQTEELRGLLRHEEQRTATAYETIQQLKRKLRETDQQKVETLAALEHVNQQLKKAEKEAAAADLAKNQVQLQTSRQLLKLSQQIKEFAQYKVLWETILPRTSHALIVTEHLDPCLEQLFQGVICSKSRLFKYIEEEPDRLEDKTVFVDRNHFTNSKKWMELRSFFRTRGITYEEFTDDTELILGYATKFKDSVTEE